MNRIIVITFSALLIAGYALVWQAAPWGLSSIPGWAPYLAS